MYASLLALLANGCTLVFVEEWTNIADVKMAQQKIQCDGVLCTTKVRLISWLYQPFRQLKWLNTQVISAAAAEEEDLFIAEVEEDQAAIISFTSGTGSPSKAIIRTHNIVNAQFAALKSYIVVSADACMCTNFPVVILLNLGIGISTFISSHINISALPQSDFKKLADEIIGNKITHLSFSPFVLYRLSQNIENPISIKQIICGGAALFPVRINQIQDKLKAESFTILYGSSEAEPIAHCSASEALLNERTNGLFVGAVDGFTELKIVKIEGEEVILCNPEEPGEVIVTGKHVVKNYMDSEIAYQQNKIVYEGKIWHRTGDYAYFNAAHQVILTGPLKYKYNRMYLIELEKQLVLMDGVLFATIVDGMAYIQMDDNAGTKERESFKRHFPFLKDIVFTDLPMDKRHYGKIKYRVLSEMKKNTETR